MAGGRVPSWVWMVLVAAHGMALGWALIKGSWDFPDSGRYWQAAENLYRYGELYARPWHVGSVPQGQAIQEFTIRPIGYPLTLLLLGRMSTWVAVVLVFQNLLSLLNIGIVLCWWARWARPTKGKWAIALISVLTFPAQLIYANAVMSEMLLQTTVLAMMAAAWFFIKTGRRRYFAGIAGTLAWALLLKPVFYPLVILLFALGVVLAWQRRRVGLALIGLVPLLVVVCYMEWNENRTGYFHFSSIAEINLLHYNAAGVVRQIDGPAVEEQWVADVLRQANAQPDFATRQQLIQNKASRVLREHPVVYGRQHIQGMLAFFVDPGRFDISQFLGIPTPVGGGLLAQIRTGGGMQAVKHLPLGLLALLGLISLANVARLVLAGWGFWQLRQGGPTWQHCGRWVVVGLLLYVALLTGPLGAARFLVPVWPLLLGLALAGLVKADGPLTSDAE